MPTYQYKAVDATGKEQSSTIDAGSEKEAGKKIREKGLFPMQGTIREQKTKGHQYAPERCLKDRRPVLRTPTRLSSAQRVASTSHSLIFTSLKLQYMP